MPERDRNAIVIRHCMPDDRAALIEQFLGLNRYEEALARNRRTDAEGAAECLDVALERVSETDGAALVAEVAGAVVGHLFLVFERDAVYVREELRPYGYVSELFVRDEARQLGIGSALLAEAERLTAARGLTRLMIGVLAGNHPAAALYARLGFAPHATELEKQVGGAPRAIAD